MNGYENANSFASLLLSALLLITPTSFGCQFEQATGRFELFDGPDSPECLKEFERIKPGFFALREQRKQTISLLFQTKSWTLGGSDFIYVELRGTEQIRSKLGQGYPISNDDSTADVEIRAEIGFGESCPSSDGSFELEGNITFTSFGTDPGDIVSGRLSSGRVTNARTDNVVFDQVQGQWRFPVRTRLPYQHFPGYGDRRADRD